MLPAIERQASIAFRSWPQESREDLIEDVVAHAMIAYKTLYERGKVDLAYPSVLAMYGIRRAKIGRRVGMKQNVRDISSQYCQQAKGIFLERLDRFDRATGQWLEVLIEDRNAGPADTAAARIDVNAWFARFTARDRKIAHALAIGESTGEAARRFRVSPSRISQKRQQFLHDWRLFQGESGEPEWVSPPGRTDCRSLMASKAKLRREQRLHDAARSDDSRALPCR
jgi:hypothetical protein